MGRKGQAEMDMLAEGVMEYVCDSLCGHPQQADGQAEMDQICEGCRMGEFMREILNLWFPGEPEERLEIVNPLVYMSVELHFEVKDAEIYGGVGSVGYTAINLVGIKDVTQITDEYVEAQTQGIADFLHVPRSAVRLISKEEYDRETEDEEEYFDDWEN